MMDRLYFSFFSFSLSPQKPDLKTASCGSMDLFQTLDSPWTTRLKSIQTCLIPLNTLLQVPFAQNRAGFPILE